MAAVRPSPPSSEVKSPAGTAGAAAGAPYTTPNASPSKQLRPHNSNVVGSGSGGLRTTPVKKGLLESTAGATAGNGSGSGGPGSGRKQKSSAPQVGALHQLAQRASLTHSRCPSATAAAFFTLSTHRAANANTLPRRNRTGSDYTLLTTRLSCVQWPLTRRTMLTPQQAMAVASPRAEKASHCRLGWTRQ